MLLSLLSDFVCCFQGSSIWNLKIIKLRVFWRDVPPVVKELKRLIIDILRFSEIEYSNASHGFFSSLLQLSHVVLRSDLDGQRSDMTGV